MFGKNSLLSLGLVLLFVLAIPAIGLADDFAGKVTSAADGKLVMTAGADQHTFVVNDKTKITVDEKEAKLEDLKAGQEVKVTATKQGEQWIASAISCRTVK
jgi:hypothetical protein